jgi:hypothetical protein
MASTMRPTLIITTTLICLAFPAVALGQLMPRDAFVVLAVGDGVTQEMADDITEAVSFAVGAQRELTFLPKERIQQKLIYKGPLSAGNCLFDNECLRQCHTDLGTRWFVVARLTAGMNGFQIVVTRIGQSPAGDLQASGQSPASTGDAINKVRALLIKVLKEPQAILVINANENDAAVYIDGKPAGKGPMRITVNAGPHKVSVTKDGYATFDAVIDCAANNQCMVPASIFPAPKEIVKRNPFTGPKIKKSAGDSGRIWRIAGWTSAGVGAGLAVMAVIAGVQATDLEQELNDACVELPCSISKGDAKAKTEEGERAAIVANISGIVGGVLLAGGAAAIIYGYLGQEKLRSMGAIEIQPYIGSHGELGIGATLSF